MKYILLFILLSSCVVTTRTESFYYSDGEIYHVSKKVTKLKPHDIRTLQIDSLTIYYLQNQPKIR